MMLMMPMTTEAMHGTVRTRPLVARGRPIVAVNCGAQSLGQKWLANTSLLASALRPGAAALASELLADCGAGISEVVHRRGMLSGEIGSAVFRVP